MGLPDFNSVGLVGCVGVDRGWVYVTFHVAEGLKCAYRHKVVTSRPYVASTDIT